MRAYANGDSIITKDLRWLAENVNEWPKHAYGKIAVCHSGHPPKVVAIRRTFAPTRYYFYGEWLQARRELGLEPSGISESDEEECLQLAYERLNKQPRYLDSEGSDWIDEFAKTATVGEFRGAMKFTIGKYLRRIGKKDALQSEVEKIRDYKRRWAEYERKLTDAL